MIVVVTTDMVTTPIVYNEVAWKDVKGILETSKFLEGHIITFEVRKGDEVEE